jgi:hypothetical protein
MTLYKFLKDNEIKYCEKSVRKSVAILKVVKNGRVAEKHKKILMLLCSKIIIKSVNGFFFLIRGIEKGNVIHEQDDIVQECFLILNKCIEKFDLKNPDYRFYFYVNSAMQKGLYRLKEKEYSSISNKHIYVNISEVVEHDTMIVKGMNHPLFLGKNFTKKEILLMQSKLDDEHIDDFCEKIDINKAEYYKVLKTIGRKINKNYFL